MKERIFSLSGAENHLQGNVHGVEWLFQVTLTIPSE